MKVKFVGHEEIFLIAIQRRVKPGDVIKVDLRMSKKLLGRGDFTKVKSAKDGD